MISGNAKTVRAPHRAVDKGKPLLSREKTLRTGRVSGEAVEVARLAVAPKGRRFAGTLIRESVFFSLREFRFVPSPPSTPSARWLGAAVFAVALFARLLFWSATPDESWPHSAYFKGDAVVWSDYAAALASNQDFELGLPLRPPGNGYLLAALGVEGRADAWRAKPIWCALGALAVLLFFRAATLAFGLAVGLAVALWSSFSTSMLVLSTSLNNETPYLVLVGSLVLTAQRLAERPATGGRIAWGALNGLACLFRAEHVVFFALGTAWLAIRDARRLGSKRRARKLGARLTPALVAFAVVLLPWHLAAWRSIADFNTNDIALDPAGEAAQRSVERATRGLRWTEGATAARAELPGFARRSAANFVAATVLVRGGSAVDAADFEILEEAFGYVPEPLASRPFVALYGPLNFYLAHRPGAPAGFDADGLDRPPRLEGGLARYPRALLGGLPPPDLNFYYPPHVELVTDGYRLGWRAIRADPGAFLRRSLQRLDILWQGAAMGWTGYNLPWGIDGTRRAVDLVVPGGAPFGVWRLALLLACVAGLGWAWRTGASAALVPWLLLPATKLAATVLFFGYARHGAALVPVVALAVALAVHGIFDLDSRPGRRLVMVAATCAALGLGVELVRRAAPPGLTLDGAAIERGDPHPLGDHRDRRLDFES